MIPTAMEAFSALLVPLCRESLRKEPVIQSFDHFFVVITKLNKDSSCQWFEMPWPSQDIIVMSILHKHRTNVWNTQIPWMSITLGPHEAGIWAKHPSLTLPAPSRYGDQQTPWLQLSAGGAHPVSIDCWLEWPVGLIHAGHAWSPPGIISKMTRRLVEFWKSLNHNST